MSNATPQRAAIYCRISLDTTGQGQGVERQEAECRRWAESRGWSITHVYVDNSISASKPEVERAKYNQMMAALQRGDHDGVVVWRLDRLTRQTRQILDIIALGYPIGTVEGSIDLETSSGQTMAVIAAQFAAQEAKDKGLRQIAANKQRLFDGRQYGRHPKIGWVDNQLTEIHPVQGPAIVKASEDILAGKKTVEIAREWNALPGMIPTRVDTWGAATVRATLLRPSNAGIVTYKGEEYPDVEPKWTPLVSRETFLAVRAKLTEKAGTQRKRSPHKHLLAGIILCSNCGSPLHYSRTNRGRDVYRCSGKVQRCWRTISYALAEEAITSYVLGTLNALSPAQFLSDEDNARRAALFTELKTVESERKDLADLVEAGTLSITSVVSLTRALDNREEKARTEFASLTTGSALSDVIARVMPWKGTTVSFKEANASLREVRKGWDLLTLAQKRLLIESLGKYYVMPKDTHPRIAIYPRDIRTGEVSPYAIDEDQYSLEG